MENLNGMDLDVVSVQTWGAVAVLIHNGKEKGGIGKGLMFQMNNTPSTAINYEVITRNESN